MFYTNLTHVVTAAIGAIILSAGFVTAAVGPATGAATAGTAYASVHNGVQANG